MSSVSLKLHEPNRIKDERPHPKSPPVASPIVVLAGLIGVAIICAAAYFSGLWTLDVRSLAGFSSVHCVIYDRPPRTGSTTISKALEECLSGKGYELTKAHTRPNRRKVIEKMVNLKGLRIGAVGGHMWMVGNDTESIRNKCDRTLFITSIRPIRERILSSLKYSLFKGHRNKTISEDVYEEALSTFNDTKRLEAYLENYPYVGDYPPKELRVSPDYIIRSEHLLQDTEKLMASLGCPNKPSSQNVHVVSSKSSKQKAGEPPALPPNLETTMGDARYKRLLPLAASQNERGLRYARLF